LIHSFQSRAEKVLLGDLDAFRERVTQDEDTIFSSRSLQVVLATAVTISILVNNEFVTIFIGECLPDVPCMFPP